MLRMRGNIWRILSSCLLKYRAFHSFCKCAQCQESYLKYKRPDSSVFSIKITNSRNNKSFGSNRHFLLAGILTWLGLKKVTEEEDTMVSVMKLGILSMEKKEHDKAENILHLALKLAQERQDMVAQTYIFDLLANLAFEKGDFSKAEKLFIQVTKELIAGGTPHDDNAIVEISLKLATIYGHRKEMEAAETGFKFCINTQRKKIENLELEDVESLSEEEKDNVLLWAMSMDWYARFLLACGRLRDAKKFFEKALDVSEHVNGASHPQTLVLLNDIGSVQSLLKEYEPAIKSFDKAIRRSTEGESKELPAFYCNLGATFMQLGDVNRGEIACKTALSLAKKMKHTTAEADAIECLKELTAMKN